MCAKYTPPRYCYWLGRLSLAGVLFFFAVSAVLQLLRPDYSFMGTPLSFYLLGPYNGWLHIAFYALAAAIVLLAIGCFAGSAPGGARPRPWCSSFWVRRVWWSRPFRPRISTAV